MIEYIAIVHVRSIRDLESFRQHEFEIHHIDIGQQTMASVVWDRVDNQKSNATVHSEIDRYMPLELDCSITYIKEINMMINIYDMI